MARKRDRVLALIRRPQPAPDPNDPSTPPATTPFLKIALELRLAIYEQLLAAELPIRLRRRERHLGRRFDKKHPLAAIVCVNHQLNLEALRVLYEVNTISINHVALNPINLPFRTTMITSLRISHWSLDAGDQHSLGTLMRRISLSPRAAGRGRPTRWHELVAALPGCPSLREVRVELYRSGGFDALHEELGSAQLSSQLRCRGGSVLFEERIVGAPIPAHLDIRVLVPALAEAWLLALEINSRAPLQPTVLAERVTARLSPTARRHLETEERMMRHMMRIIWEHDSNRKAPLRVAQVVWQRYTVVDYRTITRSGDAEMMARFTSALVAVLRLPPRLWRLVPR
ncbi:hypothetical protein LTR56_013632 [Elasticomyces elasticus]|nr:hypothetical protein LTR22_018444 [Elasticomyces elasticus]KAK3637459.1 hypothetical protein LTR56_013632 [Elasticomyces elasticus]KAK4917882.1 hypothetical protein LTR49_014286 [Elasticomyces elasticus]KAK5757041.1 hypothetical protein LTS12_012855 [Elasticomyces elasticus]